MAKVLLRRLTPVLVAATAAAVLVGCSTSEPPTTTAESVSATESTAPSVTLTPALDHLHGLHLGADGTVLAGSHTGLVAIAADGRTTRIGTSDDDFMGLAGVPGTDHLFASGHPGPSSSAPNPLGLMDSTDGGHTWTPTSLTGEVDFHALATDGKVLVGFDGTTGLLVSTDVGASWSAGAPLAAAAFAVTDGGVWAATAEGLQHSTDTARTFTAVPGAPRLTLLSAASDGSLWGVDSHGVAWCSRTGQTWVQHTVVGPVEALLAVDADTAYAATSRQLYTIE